MLYTYAIEPDALTTWEKCRHILDLMGFQHARAIAAYPNRKGWKALVRAACRENEALGDRARKRIIEKLDRSNGKLVSAGEPDDYDDSIAPAEERWIRNAVARQSARRTFHAIVATRNPEDHPDVVLEEDADESHPMLDVQREVPVLREPAALAGHMETLVRHSREVLMLIDPHFDPSFNRWRPVVRACMALAAQAVHGGTLRVELHTLDADRKPSLEDFERACRKWIPNMLPVQVKAVSVYRWRIPSDGPHDFHARYVLTDRGGYRLDKGLDEQHGMTQSVGLLPDREWKRIREGFSSSGAFFDRNGAFTVGRE